MNVKAIKNEKNLLLYQKLAHRHVGVRYPLSYLKTAKVFASYDHEGTMTGGFVLQRNLEDIRVLKSISSKVTYSLRRPVELTGVWFMPSTDPYFQRTLFWMHICIRLLPFLGGDTVFSYSSTQGALHKMYSVLKPRMLYQGWVDPLPGMSEGDHECVCSVSTHRITFLIFLSPKTLLKKLFPRKITRQTITP